MSLPHRLPLVCSLLVLAGCQGAPVPQAPVAPTAPTAADDPLSLTVAAPSLEGPTAKVTIVPPATREVLAIDAVGTDPVHRWLVSDIVEYEVHLQRLNGTTYDPVAVVHVTQKTATAYTKAQFTNLAWGQKYRAVIKAMGNNGGNPAAALEWMNQASFTAGEPLANAKAEFDYTATNDVFRTQSQAVAVALDGVNFSGSAAITVTTPTAGTFLNPVPAPTATTTP